MAGFGSFLLDEQDREEDVSKLAAQMASQDNALMQRAAQTGMQTANSRGLLNSSIAAGAAQGEVLDRVIPMASQVGQQNFQRNQGRRQVGYEQLIEAQRFEQNKTLQTMDADSRKELAQMDLDWNRELAAMNIGAQTKQNAGGLLASIYGDHSQTVATILNNTNIKAKDRSAMIAAAKETMRRQIVMAESLYSVDLPDNLFAAPSVSPTSTWRR